MLSEFLSSRTRAEILGLLFNGQGAEYYLRDIEKISGISISSIQKEVKNLLSLDLIKSRIDGNRIYYSANRIHPLYPDLVSIVEKTVGVIGLIGERLVDEKIETAFIFGSVAKGKEKSQSDIDLVVVGSIGMRGLTKLLSGLQEKLNREINPHIFTAEEFKKRIAENDHFLTSILKEQLKVIKGRIDEYR